MEGSIPPAPALRSPGSPPSPLWSRASSSSSLASSFRAESFDFCGYPPQSELEEVPSFRWLRGDLSADPVAAPIRRPATEIIWSEGYKLICEGHQKPGDPKSFTFEGSRGKKCAFLPAYALMVGGDKDLWRCTEEYKEGKRSVHAVELRGGYYLDVRGTVDVATLPAAAEYTAHLVFRLSGRAFGFRLQEASVEIGARTYEQNICLQPEMCGIAGRVAGVAVVPQEAADGWMSIEMGRFFTERRRSRDQSKQLLLLGLKEGRKVEEQNRRSFADEMEVLRWKEGLVIGGVLVKPVAMADRGAEGLVRGLRSLAVGESEGFPQQRRRG